jgi:hypothetical protein
MASRNTAGVIRRTTKAPVRAAIPPEVQATLRARLDRRLQSKWRRTGAELVVRFRGRFAYVGTVRTGNDDVSPLFRLTFSGDADQWAFALYKYSDDDYELCLGASGSFAATPEQSLDCAARLYLA